MIDTWRASMTDQVNKTTSLVSIMFYVYLFVGLIGFTVAWLIYLSKLNDEMNESIRMLNMIPFRLLSRCRKETRSFIVWIIKEANMKNHTIS